MSVQPDAAAASRYMNDDVVAEILLRLPSDAMLRSRAVCKAWHRIATSPAFLAAHARLRPLEIIVQRHGVNGVLDTIPAATLDEARRRCLHVRYPEYTGPPEPCWRGYSLMASCDGLLLFQRGAAVDHFVCNPATSQWTKLPRPTGDVTLLCGFYLHGPSGEHRLLFLTDDQQGSHHICSLEVAAGSSRRVGPAIPVVGFCTEIPLACLNHRGKLHWLLHPDVIFPTDDAQRPEVEDRILAFDTVSETFRRISPPSRRSHRYLAHFFLLEMDGKLSMTDIYKGSMNIWVLEDYNNDKSWTRRVRVDLPPSLPGARWAMSSGLEGQNAILLGDWANCSVGLYDLTRKRVLKQIYFVTSDNPWDIVRRTPLHALVFRDSLERHAFFDLEAGPSNK